jgi:SAM-dependent methyltransferase
MLFGQYGSDYRRAVLWQRLLKGDRMRAFEAAIGGAYEDIGERHVAILRDNGFTDAFSIVDVGCGAGRTAVKLRHLPGVAYLGTDVVPELLDHARAAADRADWRFLQVSRTAIPAPATSADVCLFMSVFTHLPDDACLAYLAECQRVLRPEGAVIFSFLDPAVPHHDRPLKGGLFRFLATRTLYARNVGQTPDQLRQWAENTGFSVASIESPHPFGQSLAVFRKPV